MNLILFDSSEISSALPLGDPRARHVLEVLRRQPGDSFDVGLINGPPGKATLIAVHEQGLELNFAWGLPPPAFDPLTLVIGFPRPQTCRKILQDASTLGVAALRFVSAERAEPSYRQSTLWSSGEWRRHLRTGAEQAFDTRLPEVAWTESLPECLAALPASAERYSLDNYEASGLLGSLPRFAPSDSMPPTVLALGPERGWTNPERDLFRQSGFKLVGLGPRVLRLETAVVAAIALLKARFRQM